MPPRLVEFDHVHEDERRLQRIERLLDESVGSGVRRRVLAADVPAREQIIHLADPDTRDAGIGHEVEQRRPGRRNRKILAIGRPAVVPSRAFEGPRDHPAYRFLPDQHLARDAAGAVQLIERHCSFVRRHLEHRIRRRIHDPFAATLMLDAELGDDRRTRRRFVAEPPASCAFCELVQQWNGKSLGIRAKRLLQEHAADLPMPGGAVLSC